MREKLNKTIKRTKRLCKSLWVSASKTPNKTIQNLSSIGQYAATRFWLVWYWCIYTLFIFKKGFSRKFIIILFIVVNLVAFGFLNEKIKNSIFLFFTNTENFKHLKTALLSVGTLLFGLTSVIVAIILHTAQANIQRLPYNLFHKMTRDKKLLGTFFLSITFPAVIIAFSFIENPAWALLALFVLFCGTFGSLVTVYYAYVRGLYFTNSYNQINCLECDIVEYMKDWSKKASRIGPYLIENMDKDEQPSIDLSRFAFFMKYPQWFTYASTGIDNLIIINRYFSRQGEYAISDAALESVVRINAEYIKTKGKTFFTNNIIFENPDAKDAFVNHTLEHLRKIIAIGIENRDEQCILQIFRTFSLLVTTYLTIEYPSPDAEKHHASLALGYLDQAIQDTIPCEMIDVLICGLRLLGGLANQFTNNKQTLLYSNIINGVYTLGLTGLIHQKYMPVTTTAFEQYANMSYSLFFAKDYDITFITRELREKLSDLTSKYLKADNNSFIINTPMGAFYGFSGHQCFLSQFTKLADMLIDAESGHQNGKLIIKNIECWANGLYITQKALLLSSIEKNSNFMWDIIRWIVYITKLLMRLSCAPICTSELAKKLASHSIWLFSTLSFIPTVDGKTVERVEICQFTELLFEIAQETQNIPNKQFKKIAIDRLLSWGFEACKHSGCEWILEKSLCGLAIIILLPNSSLDSEALKQDILDKLSKDSAPGKEIRVQIANNMRTRAANLHNKGHWSSTINVEMGKIDDSLLKPVLELIANALHCKT